MHSIRFCTAECDETFGQCVAAIGIRCIYVTRLSVSRRLLVAIIAPCSDSHIVYLLYLEKKTSYGAMFTLTLSSISYNPYNSIYPPSAQDVPPVGFPKAIGRLRIGVNRVILK